MELYEKFHEKYLKRSWFKVKYQTCTSMVYLEVQADFMLYCIGLRKNFDCQNDFSPANNFSLFPVNSATSVIFSFRPKIRKGFGGWDKESRRTQPFYNILITKAKYIFKVSSNSISLECIRKLKKSNSDTTEDMLSQPIFCGHVSSIF